MNTKKCPRCRRPIPADGPKGLCPQCLIELAQDGGDFIVTNGGDRSRPPPDPSEIQGLFPHLEILRLIGRGGMGAVYEVRQRGLNRTAALKILWADSIPDAAFEERFLREGRALAQLSHDNIIAVHDAGKADPYYWLLMEYIDGPNLRQFLEAGPIEPEQALRIVMQMCSAIDYAHQNGVVHRDIKPENVLVTRNGRVKVADFGLAKVLDRRTGDRTLTGSLQVMGTPDYMAPEQRKGSKDVDHRADIYSLGVIFYELLTGELPVGRFELPSFKVEVDQRVDGIVAKALQQDPNRRYQAASEVRTAVHQVATKKPAEVRRRYVPPSTARKIAPLVGVFLAVAAAVWFVAAKYGELFAGAKPKPLTAQEHLSRGEQLVVSPVSFHDGMSHFEAAHDKDRTLPAWESKAVAAIRRRLDDGVRTEDPLRWALRLRERAPSPQFDALVDQVMAVADDEWRKVVHTEPADGAIVNASVARLTGKLDRSLSDATLRIDGRDLVVASSRFEHVFPNPLADGKHEVPLEVRFADGTVLPLPITLTVDTAAPTLEVHAPRQDALVKGRFSVEGVVRDTATRCRVTCNDAPAEVDETGRWRAQLTLDAGTQEITVVARDAADHPTSIVRTVVVDTEPPRALLLTRGEEFEFASRQPIWAKPNQTMLLDRVRVADDHEVAAVVWEGRKVNFDARGLVASLMLDQAMSTTDADRLIVTDSAGNSMTYAIEVRRDGSAPRVVFDPGDAHVVIGQEYVLRGEFDDEGPCTPMLDGSEAIPIEGSAFEVPITVSESTRSVKLRLVDEAGNQSPPLFRTLIHEEPCKGASCVIVRGVPGRCGKCAGNGINPDNTCKVCEGDGKETVDCDVCKKTGRVLCVPCGGDGEMPAEDCDQCGGQTLPCDNGCNAEGQKWKQCPDCDGTGRLKPDRFRLRGGPCRTGWWEQCAACNGKTRLKCSKCMYGVRCPAKCSSGMTSVTCPECKKTKRRDIECPKCGGEGSIERQDCKPCRGGGVCRQCDGTGQAGT